MARRSRLAGLALALLCVFGAGAQAAEPSARLKALQEAATAHYREGAHKQALDAAKQALALTIQEFGPDDEQTSIQTYSVAFIAEILGDFALAERQYRDSLRIRDKVYGVDSAASSMVMEKLAGVLMKAGRAADAEPIFERVLKVRKDLLGEHAFSASAYGGLADARFARGNYSGALPLYTQAIELLTKQNQEQAVVKSLVEADIKRNRDVFIGLSRTLWALRGQPGRNPIADMDTSYGAGQLAWATSAASALAKMTARLKAGDTDLGRTMRDLQGMSDRILALHDEDMKALAAWSEVQRADPAYRPLQDAFTKLATEQNRVNAPVAKRQKELVEALQAQMARCPPGQAKPSCENGDREREAITTELGQLAAQIAPGAARITELVKRMTAAEEKLPGYGEYKARREARLAESQRLEALLAEERKGVVGKFPQYMSLSEPRPLTVANTQQLLGDDEALVAILTGSLRTVVWVVTREKADWAEVDVSEDMLAADVAALRRGLDPMLQPPAEPSASVDRGPITVVRGFDLARAHTLYKLLLGRFQPMLAAKRHLLLVPTGPLTSLPFQVLLTEPPSGATPAAALRGAQWLIRRHALSVLPSVPSLSSLRKLASTGTAVQPFFGIGDPVLIGPGAVTPQKRGAAPATPVLQAVYRNGLVDVRALRELMPLPETADELAAVARTLRAPPDSISLREAATETRVKASPLGQYRVLHFATHGLVAGDLDGVNEPALVLTPPPVATEADDGLLTASEIATLKLDADWVVLSACNTAAGDKVGADALSGLARAFFFAGARALLVSHWAVYSQAAVALTTRTFANLAVNKRMGRAEAFRRAMLTVIDEGQPPSYWAPFVVVGEGGTGPAGTVR
jgi:CHAT domain-containing protein/tetratricopeptide (TPR) repeat protein